MFTFRPAIRENTPTIIGIAGPTKSGKTMSALRLATGLANGGKIAMINTEGPRGNQYADKFEYLVVDLTEPFSMKRYEEAIKSAIAIKPSVLIIDSITHAHEGIGGMLDQHETELDRMAGDDYKKRERMTWAAWVKPKADEAKMVGTMLQAPCHIILCFRAKEKIKIVKGKDPVDLGWQPISSDRIQFETLFTLILPPHSKGTPDMGVSYLREPFDNLIKGQLDEKSGNRVFEWAMGSTDKLPPIREPDGNDNPPEPDMAGLKIIKVTKKDGIGKGGIPYTKYTIIDSNNKKYGSFSATHANIAIEARDKGLPVNIVSEPPENPAWAHDLVNIEIKRPPLEEPWGNIEEDPLAEDKSKIEARMSKITSDKKQWAGAVAEAGCLPNPTDWTKKDIDKLVKHLDKYEAQEKRVSEDGKLPAEEEFTPENEKDKLLDLLREVTTNPEQIEAMCVEAIGKGVNQKWDVNDIKKMEEYIELYERIKEEQ